MSDIQALHAQFQERYTLTNPPPIIAKRQDWQDEYEKLNPKPIWEVDWPVTIAQLISTSGATILSATRVGYSLALVGALAKFGNVVHLPVADWILALGESIAAIAAIEIGLIAAGLLWGTYAKTVDKRWFWVMIGIIGFIALATNVTPAAALKGEEAMNGAAYNVNIIVGLGTPFMVIIGGKILSSNYYGGKFAYNEKLMEWQSVMRESWNKIQENHKTDFAKWEAKAGGAFTRSEEYRQRPRANQNAAQEKDLVRLLNAQPGHIMPVQDAAVGLNILPKDIWQITSGSLVTETAGTDVRLTNGNIKSG
jgi:hypothetical protein